MAGLIDREFGWDDDPLGRPRAHDTSHLPLLPITNRALQIPRLHGQRDLRHLAGLASYPLLEARSAIALVKAARLFQNALWIADSAPETTWLLLVSALETAANHWDGETKTPIERPTTTYPRLVSLLVEHDREALVPKVAKILKGIIGSTDKFVTFVDTFAPPVPDERPAHGQFNFTPENLSAALRRIYKLRSRALHAGTPFPFPMCHSPRHFRRRGRRGADGTGSRRLGRYVGG